MYRVAKPDTIIKHLKAEGPILEQPRRRTSVAVAGDTGLLGLIEFEDAVRPEAAETVSHLAALGIRRTSLITGDGEDAAKAVSDSIGTDEYRADLLPEDKVSIIAGLRERFGTVAMVGDGVNDAPALAAADVGIAMGAAGSDTAIDTADVALMSDDISKLVPLFALAKMVRRITLENISLAFAIKAAFLVMAALGTATMWMAVFADMGASLIVIGNALRLLSGKAMGQEIKRVRPVGPTGPGGN
jgi:Cd2+/Zn2+-exporting ATPase